MGLGLVSPMPKSIMEECAEINDVRVCRLDAHCDNRGWFKEVGVFNNIGPEKITQVSLSRVHPGIIKAWHGHKTQYQWTTVVRGTLEVFLYDNRKDASTYGKHIRILAGDEGDNYLWGFGPGVLHGYRNIGSTADVLYLTSEMYDREKEIRVPYDSKTILFNWSETIQII